MAEFNSEEMQEPDYPKVPQSSAPDQEQMDADSLAFMQLQPPPPAFPPTVQEVKEMRRRARLATQPDLPQVDRVKEYGKTCHPRSCSSPASTRSIPKARLMPPGLSKLASGPPSNATPDKCTDFYPTPGCCQKPAMPLKTSLPF